MLGAVKHGAAVTDDFKHTENWGYNILTIPLSSDFKVFMYEVKKQILTSLEFEPYSPFCRLVESPLKHTTPNIIYNTKAMQLWCNLVSNRDMFELWRNGPTWICILLEPAVESEQRWNIFLGGISVQCSLLKYTNDSLSLKKYCP